MPGRRLSLSNYRFGFNTQEKDDEISGQGNHNTARFWEYDSRLGRRWDVDPIKKSWQSDYLCFSDNPIWKTDPDGNDDFFNADGSLSYRTKTGTKIYVQTKNGTKLFSQIRTNNMHNRQVLANITSFYAGLVGIKGMVGVGNHRDEKDDDGNINHHKSDNTLAYTTGDNILLNAKGGKINEKLDDYNNLESTLMHEKDHKSKGQGFLKETSHREEAEVYLTQFSDKKFSETTDAFQRGMIEAFKEELIKASTKDQTQDSDIQGLIVQANKALEKTGFSISFKRTSSDTFGFEINIATQEEPKKNKK